MGGSDFVKTQRTDKTAVRSEFQFFTSVCILTKQEALHLKKISHHFFFFKLTKQFLHLRLWRKIKLGVSISRFAGACRERLKSVE
jgi:hypothetical protein